MSFPVLKVTRGFILFLVVNHPDVKPFASFFFFKRVQKYSVFTVAKSVARVCSQMGVRAAHLAPSPRCVQPQRLSC